MRKLLCAVLAAVLAASAALLAGCGLFNAGEKDAIEKAAGDWALLEGGPQQTSGLTEDIPAPRSLAAANKWLRFNDHTVTYFEGSEPDAGTAVWTATMTYHGSGGNTVSFDLEGADDCFYLSISYELTYKDDAKEEHTVDISAALLRIGLRMGTEASYSVTEYVAYRADALGASFSLDGHFEYVPSADWAAQSDIVFYGPESSYPLNDPPLVHGLFSSYGSKGIVYASKDTPGLCLYAKVEAEEDKNLNVVTYEAYEFVVVFVPYENLNIGVWENL